jgi:glycine cleavage system H protein
MYPENFRYSKDHEWVKVEGDIAVIGITDHAQKQLGDIVFVEVPEIDDEFEKGDEVGSIESVKAVAEMFLPVSGTVVEVNEALEDAPETLNKDPHGEGWILKVKLSDTSEIDELMDVAAYQNYLKEEGE